MENELSSAIMERVITEKLLEAGLVDENIANIYLGSIDAEIDEHVERLTESCGYSSAISYIDKIFRESELECEIKWRSVV